MDRKKKRNFQQEEVKINYNEEIETDTFDYFKDDDPYKEIIIS